MDKETFTELERLKTALTELEKCSLLIKDAKVVTEKSLKQVEEVITTFKDRSDKLISQFENEAKLLSDTREKLNSDFGKYLRQISEVIGKGLDDASRSIDNLNKQLSNQLEIHHGVLNAILTSVSDVKSKLVEVEKANDEMFKKLISEQTEHKKEFIKMFEKVSKENNLLKILLFVSIGLSIGLILFRAITGQ